MNLHRNWKSDFAVHCCFLLIGQGWDLTQALLLVRDWPYVELMHTGGVVLVVTLPVLFTHPALGFLVLTACLPASPIL